ncbi:hypothetical protein GGS26DRAFT_400908 [Hypomontagnella submonticulosa]|nr:hypothetical protein GGS26DRAFT_400908 [Hypomontagnella submonticulosa]
MVRAANPCSSSSLSVIISCIFFFIFPSTAAKLPIRLTCHHLPSFRNRPGDLTKFLELLLYNSNRTTPEDIVPPETLATFLMDEFCLGLSHASPGSLSGTNLK